MDSSSLQSGVRLSRNFPLVGDDGQRVPNHTVKLPGPIERLPGVVTAANPDGKTTLIEFYDLNCPFCRIASVDIGDMVEDRRQSQARSRPLPGPRHRVDRSEPGRAGGGKARHAGAILRVSSAGSTPSAAPPTVCAPSFIVGGIFRIML